MKRDLWLTRHEGILYAALAEVDEAPVSRPHKGVKLPAIYKAARRHGVEIVSVGIVPPDMLGLVDIEVSNPE